MPFVLVQFECYCLLAYTPEIVFGFCFFLLWLRCLAVSLILRVFNTDEKAAVLK
jgi:hypothetical protein